MGEHPRPGSERMYKYKTLLNLSSKEPIVINIDTSDGIRAVMIPNYARMSKVKPRLILPQPMASFPFCSPDPFFYSKARLEPVSKFRLCKVGGKITGILLSYSDGSMASLGGIRLDQLSDDITADAHGLWIRSVYSERRIRAACIVSIIDVTQNRPEADLESYLHVRWHGEIEWWYSHRQCEVHYEGGQTLSTVM